jgi:F-type H+-transporting ATPase subunit c
MDISTVWAVLQMGVAQAAEEATTKLSSADIKTMVACFSAAIAIGLGVVGAGSSEGYAAAKACEGVARNPQASGAILRTMLMGQAITESTSIYALVIALLILFVM